ncbi:MAG: DNA translocase FtsK [Bacteroidota bacterium]
MSDKKNTIKNVIKNEPKPLVEEKIGKKPKEKVEDTEKANTIKNQPKAEKSEKKTVKSEGRKFNFRLSDKFVRILGLFLFLASIYLVLAFTSFIFTWKLDVAFPVEGGWLDTFANRTIFAENILGKFGSFLAYLFIYKWFGIASYLFVFIFFILGFKLSSGFSILPLGKTIRYSVFVMIWTSIAASLILYKDNQLIFGGNFGYQAKMWSISLIGQAGTALLLFFSMIGFSVLVFDTKFAWLGGLIPQKKEKSESAIDTSSASRYNAVRNNTVINPVTTEINEEDLTEEELAALEPVLITKDEIDEDEEDVDDTDEIDEDEDELIEDTIVLQKVVDPIIEEPIIAEKISVAVDEIPMEITPIVYEKPISSNDLELEVEKTEEEIPFSVEVVEEKPTDAVMNDSDIDELAKHKVEEFGEYDPTLDLPNFQFPSIELLEQYAPNTQGVQKEELEANKNRIVSTLANYGIGIAQIKATIGPTVTLYEIVPEAGVRISKIKNLEDDIALSLAALGIRIIAPIPGKGTIGIEVPNQIAEVVSMRSVVSSEKFQLSKMDLPIVLGKTITNETFTFDLAKMPHLLMAGATGQGKSVGLNAILTSLLYKKHPSELKFILVDPKKVELTLYNKIERHYLAKLPGSDEAIITDTKKVVSTLNSLCIEMDNRYNLLKDAMVRNLKEYNEKFKSRRLNPENGHRFLPYIVVVVDEFADLIQTAGRDVEGPIARLAQLARAIGIHLIIATQRPSVNVITGLIKANFPARIAFRVTSKIDSRTILDSGGADQLIGRGDLLFSTGNDLTRIQCAFVDTPEVERIADFIGAQRGYPDAFLLPEVQDEQSEGNGDIDAGDRDTLFSEAARVIVQHQQGSTSLIQRKMKLGYNRAGRIIDQLEAAGIVGPFEGSKAREVKIKDIVTLEQLLSDIEKKF